jgi:hypothetical protein
VSTQTLAKADRSTSWPEAADKSHKSLSWRHLLAFGPLSGRQVWTSAFRAFAEGQYLKSQVRCDESDELL